MKLATTRELFSYWNNIRGYRLAPERADVDPVAIRGLLSHTFMLEVDRSSRFPFRLTGSRLNALFLRELKGSSFVGLWDSHERSLILDLLHSLLDDVAPVVIGAGAAPQGYLAVDLELLLLPLRHRGKTHERILGSLIPARHSSWFGLIAAENLQLRSARVLRNGELLATAASIDEPNKTARSETAASSITRRPHLTVYEGGR
jgi:hypothetical protein